MRGRGVVMCIVLEKVECRIIVGHCLIVRRGGAQEITIICVHYSQWAKKERSECKKRSTYWCQYKDCRNDKNSRTNFDSHSVKLILKY